MSTSSTSGRVPIGCAPNSDATAGYPAAAHRQFMVTNALLVRLQVGHERTVTTSEVTLMINWRPIPARGYRIWHLCAFKFKTNRRIGTGPPVMSYRVLPTAEIKYKFAGKGLCVSIQSNLLPSPFPQYFPR